MKQELIIYVALCSTADRAMMQLLRDRPELTSVYLCLDHDGAGIEGAYRLADSIRTLDRECTIWRTFSKYKDWDEDLKALHGKQAILASKHPKAEQFRAAVEKLYQELQNDMLRIESPDVVGRYKGDALFASAHTYLTQAERSEQLQIRYLTDVARTMLLGYMAYNKGITLDDAVRDLKDFYRPHKDYDSVERLWKSIKTELSSLASQINGKDAHTATEWGFFCKGLLQVAMDCIRQCGNMQREREEQIKKNELVYNES